MNNKQIDSRAKEIIDAAKANEDRLEQEYFDRWPDITQAAANKAAEEGGLPANKRLDALQEAANFAWAYGKDELANTLREIIAADRASRQVANKAEVEPVAWMRITDITEWADTEPETDGWTPLYATPPATTGASTANIREILESIVQDGYLSETKAHRARRALDESVGASTVLTDERIDAMHTLILEVLSNHRMVRMFEVEEDGLGNSYPLIDRLCPDDEIDLESGKVEADAIAWAIADKLSETDIFAREVAAQAGQVAVPDGWKLVPIKPTDEMVEESRGFLPVGARHHGPNVYSAMVAAAPSPAKESK